ncbi:dUTP diphosphatase [Agaribacterium sp. ZY112]|uniref:dUTP diphosphatase n=1 Tax=Agaribacterium sp. ZY112 TaxID=3233574 RepID=UPI0035269D52
MRQQLITMLELQDAMNTKVNADWREAGNAWYRAIWVECAELLDHYGWKWWKAQEPDIEQVELELIDIWHFGISIALEQSSNYEALAQELESKLFVDETKGDFRESLELFALNTLQSKAFDVAGFAGLMRLAGLDFDSLFTRYVAKNVLNIFRQDHGYKEGSYIKLWAGKEDNEHLMEILAQLSGAECTKECIYSELEARYQSMC